MKICYEIEGDFLLDGMHWFLMKYTVTDPSHEYFPPGGGGESSVATLFARGDFVDIPFPIQDADAPVFLDVAPWVTTDLSAAGWRANVNYDSSGGDFGEAFRVILTARRDNVALTEFKIACAYAGEGIPGSQPWGFAAVGAMNRHSERGDTTSCNAEPTRRWRIVERYSLSWQTESNRGVIHLFFKDGFRATVRPESVQELSALADILRNEKPVWYHTITKSISTGKEPIGEGEG